MENDAVQETIKNDYDLADNRANVKSYYEASKKV